jgi:hypothetical protein
MEHNLDIEATHFVQWLKEYFTASTEPMLEISVRRIFTAEPIAEKAADISKDDEISLMAATGILEVTPAGNSHSKWLLRMRVEDTLGGQLPEQGSVLDSPEEMTLEAFETEFILPDRGAIFMTLEAETQEIKDAFDAFLADVITDRHGA